MALAEHAVYRTEFEPRPSPEALVIHCSDPRYQFHFQEFLRQHLGLDTYELIAVPGGPQFLTAMEFLPKFSWVGWRWVKFLVDVAKPTRVILIGHEGCRWYKSLHLLRRQAEMRRLEERDLHTVAAELKERFSALALEKYFARHEGEHVVFELVR